MRFFGLRVGWASERAFLVKDNFDLVLKRKAAHERIDRLAAGHAVVVCFIAAAIGLGNEMFNARLTSLQFLATEEASVSLCK